MRDSDQQNRHPVWSERYRGFTDSLSQIKLAILVLGPSQGSEGDSKRVEIKEHLRQLSENYDATFSEELEPKMSVSKDTHILNIAFHIANADLVFALLLNDLRVTGVLTELNKFDDYAKFREKTYLIVPKRRQSTGKNDFVPLIWQTVDRFPNDHKFPYNSAEFRSCDSIRNFVATIADRFSKRIAYENLLRESGISLPVRIDEVD